MRDPVGAAKGVILAVGILGAGTWYRDFRMRGIAHTDHARRGTPAPGRLDFELTEIAEQAGLVNTHQKFQAGAAVANVAPLIAAFGGASVAVVDYDNDGWPDVYVTNSAVGSKNKLFHNNHDGTFTEVGEKAGLADVNQEAGSNRALFFDYDNDGYEDLFLTTTYCPKLFHNNGDGTFTDVTAGSGITHCGWSHAANALDIDGSGRLDLVVADFFKAVDLSRPDTFDFMWNKPNAANADNGGPILVYRNEGHGKFKRIPDALGIKSRGWTHVVGVYDMDGDGRPDLYFATDYGTDQLYMNRGGRFVNASARLHKGYSNSGMSAEIADIDDDGHPAVFVSDIYDPAGDPGQNYLAKSVGGAFESLADARGVSRCGWSWGAKFVDLGNDGKLDLVETNGFISANPNKDYLYFKGVMDAAGQSTREDSRNWYPVKDSSFNGYETKCLWRNVGGRFEDVTELTPLKDDVSDGRGIAAIDYLNNGSMSLVEANSGQPLKFYGNEQRNSNRWIGFDLRGTRGSRDAWGTRVAVRLKDRTLTRELEPANGFLSQSDRRLQFGLGAYPEVQEIVVRWPSGAVSRFKDLPLDRYHVVREPAS